MMVRIQIKELPVKLDREKGIGCKYMVIKCVKKNENHTKTYFWRDPLHSTY